MFVAGNGIDVAQIPGYHLAFAEYNFVRKLDEFVKADSSFDIEPYYTRIVDYYNTPSDGLWCLPVELHYRGLILQQAALR